MDVIDSVYADYYAGMVADVVPTEPRCDNIESAVARIGIEYGRGPSERTCEKNPMGKFDRMVDVLARSAFSVNPYQMYRAEPTLQTLSKGHSAKYCVVIRAALYALLMSSYMTAEEAFQHLDHGLIDSVGAMLEREIGKF